MALSVSPTLAELRQSVAIRLNMGQQVATSTAQHPVIDEYIRQAFNLLVRDANWVILEAVEEIALIDKQHEYDVPDQVDVGDIREITVQNKDNFEFLLHPGVEYYERNAYRIDRGNKENEGQLPLRWVVEDKVLKIYPAPDATQYPKMFVRGRAIPRAPYKNGDRAYIDGESHIAQAVVSLKRHYNMPGAENDERILARHLVNIRAAQSDGETVQIGPTRSQRFPDLNGRLPSDRGLFYPDFDPDVASLYNRGF